MTLSSRVKLTAYIVTGAWSLALLLSGVKLPSLWEKLLSALPLLIVLAFAVFDNWLWRMRPIRALARRPDLNGTWRGALVSLRDGGDGSEVEHPPIPIFVSIHQSYLTLSITLMSEESRSNSIATTIVGDSPGHHCVYYHYTNLPGMLVRSRSPSHAGGARFDVDGLLPSTLTGEYWTDRRTRGTLRLTRESRKRYASWAQAVEALGEEP